MIMFIISLMWLRGLEFDMSDYRIHNLMIMEIIQNVLCIVHELLKYLIQEYVYIQVQKNKI